MQAAYEPVYNRMQQPAYCRMQGAYECMQMQPAYNHMQAVCRELTLENTRASSNYEYSSRI